MTVAAMLDGSTTINSGSIGDESDWMMMAMV